MGSPKFAVSARQMIKTRSPGLEASSGNSGLCAYGLPEPKRLHRQTTTKNSLGLSPRHRGRGVWAAPWLQCGWIPPSAKGWIFEEVTGYFIVCQQSTRSLRLPPNTLGVV